MPVSDDKATEMLAALGRIERAQERFVAAADNVLSALEVHNEKLDAILAAAAQETGPSPTAAILRQIVSSLGEQSALLEMLPQALARSIRDELQREDDLDIDAEGGEAWEPEERPG